VFALQVLNSKRLQTQSKEKIANMNFKSIKNKKTFCSLSLILMLAMTLIIAFAEPSLAQIGVPQPEKTIGYIDVSPHLVGVGQEATVNLFVYPIPTDMAYLGYYDGYRGVVVTFVKPDGTKDSFKPVDGTGVYDPGQTQSLGALYFFYKPDMVGNWSVSFTMPDQNLTDTTGTVLMSGCTSGTAHFTVQTEPVLAGLLNGYPWSPLPNSNSYWSYPINLNNREWSQISGDWLGSSSTGATVSNPTCRLWQPYGTGPNTPHIVWDQPIRMGGLVGGEYGSISYGAQGDAINSVIINGKVFVNLPGANKFECVDLTTGKVLYTTNGSISYGLHLPGNAYTQSSYSPTGNVVLESSYGNTPTANLYGTSGTTWNYFDAYTGTVSRSITNATISSNPSSGAGSIYYLVDGTPLAYAITGTAPRQNLVRWNMSKVVSNNWPTGIEWQKPLPATMIGQLNQTSARGSSSTQINVYGVTSDQSTLLVRAAPNQYWGYSTKDGTSLWNLTLNYPAMQNEEITLYPTNNFIVFDPTAMTFKCYSMITGTLLWTSTSFSDNPWATTWTVYLTETSDNNNFYAMFPDGTVRAYSLTDGHEIWRSTPFASTEYPNNAVPYVDNMVMVGGNIYVCAGYSSFYRINPVLRFGTVVCINATTGENTWTLNGGLRPSSAANGYVIATGDNDGNMYCIGKGPTSTTVTAQQQVGGSVLIQGSVLDSSPASYSADLTTVFPNGVPAISDADMSVWMDYLHMQNATLTNSPPNCNGVPVTLTAIDPNGNSINIGTVTSDGDGHFEYQWTSTTAGLYKIYATFAGSESYFTSHGVTSTTVTSAAAPTAVPTSATEPIVSTSDLMLYFAATAIAIIIAIAIVGVLILRRKA
jgi:hypothetical protein